MREVYTQTRCTLEASDATFTWEENGLCVEPATLRLLAEQGTRRDAFSATGRMPTPAEATSRISGNYGELIVLKAPNLNTQMTVWLRQNSGANLIWSGSSAA